MDEKEPVRVGPRASNTIETLRPKEVNVTFPGPIDYPFENEVTGNFDFSQPLQGRGLPAKSVQTPDKSEKIYEPETYVEPPKPEPPRNLDYKLTVPKISPRPSYVPEKVPVVDRVELLENKVQSLIERVDGILDRLAAYNVKSSHKI